MAVEETSGPIHIGVSRTSKTPLSMYMAQRGYKVANIPVVPGQSAYMTRQGLTRNPNPHVISA